MARKHEARAWGDINQVQQPADAQLRRLGYQFIAADAIELERDSPADAVLTRRLDAALRRLNPWIDDANVVRAIRALAHVSEAGLVEANERVHAALVHGLTVEQDRGTGRFGQTVRVIDFDDPHCNDLLFTHQYRVAGARRAIVADLVVFVNGLPIVVMEFAGPAQRDRLEGAKQQLLSYQEIGDDQRGQGVSRLFHTVQIVVASCGQAAVYGTVGTPAAQWSEWKASHPLTLDQLTATLGRIPTPQDVLLCGMLSPPNLLDLLRNFIVFEADGGGVRKLLAHYWQFMAVNRAIERIQRHEHADRGGVVWHAPGAGTSMTMVFLATKLRRLPGVTAPTLLVVSDRKDLDNQLTAVFRRCRFPNPHQARSARDLHTLLGRPGPQTVMTTVQKFGTTSDLIVNDSARVFILVDEAHRSQQAALAGRMRRALPNACFIGFTSTPTPVTTKLFGSYLHTYGFEQAVADRATVPIYYEARRPHEDESDRIEAICRDLVSHFETAIRPNGFKARVMASSRELAITYKETLDRLGAPESAIVISSTSRDSERLHRWRSTKPERQQVFDRFRDPDDPLALLVVCDLVTGVDSSIEQVLYLDAPLRGPALLQAVARVNRMADGKDYGLVVDYFGIGRSIEEALETYTAAEVHGALRPKDDLIALLESHHRAAMECFEAVPRDDDGAWIGALASKEVRAGFEQAFRRFARGMDMLLPDRAAQPFVDDLVRLLLIRDAACLRYRDPQLDAAAVRAKVRALLEYPVAASLHLPTSHFHVRFEEMIGERARSPEPEDASVALCRLLSAVGEDDDACREQADRMMRELSKLAVVDWIQREDVQRRMRQAVKRNLRSVHVSPAAIDDLVPRVMKLVQAWLSGRARE